MARRFEFRDNTLELDIAGNIFQIDATAPETVQQIQKFAVEAQERATKLAKRDDFSEAMKEAIQFCLDTIDSILGTGAAEKIFTGRKINLYDCLDVINFIVEEIEADREERFKAYSPTRVQRRAAKK